MSKKQSKDSAQSMTNKGQNTLSLSEQRKRIDQIDQELLDLLNQRLEIAREIGGIKDRQSFDVLDSGRETEIFRRLLDLNQGRLLSCKALYEIFAKIISASREIQIPTADSKSGHEAPALFAVVGNPVSHSLSPIMHNHAFSAIGCNGLYIPLEADDIQTAIYGLKSLNFKGASITIPHKESVIDYLDELDDAARRIKAVNTLVNSDGRLIGYNTDGFGAMRALSEKIDIAGKDVAIIGAGGAARAIGFGIKAQGGRIIIVNRSIPRGEQLAHELDGGFMPLSEVEKLDCDILINTTPIGMTPNVDDMCLPKTMLQNNMVVMDIIYTPLKTKLLREAEKIGCACIDGLSMFVYQGAQQFNLWTGQEAPVDIMRLAVLSALENS